MRCLIPNSVSFPLFKIASSKVVEMEPIMKGQDYDKAVYSTNKL